MGKLPHFNFCRRTNYLGVHVSVNVVYYVQRPGGVRAGYEKRRRSNSLSCYQRDQYPAFQEGGRPIPKLPPSTPSPSPKSQQRTCGTSGITGVNRRWQSPTFRRYIDSFATYSIKKLRQADVEEDFLSAYLMASESGFLLYLSQKGSDIYVTDVKIFTQLRQTQKKE